MIFSELEELNPRVSRLIALRSALRSIAYAFSDEPKEADFPEMEGVFEPHENLLLQGLRLAQSMVVKYIQLSDVKLPQKLFGDGGYYLPDGPMHVGDIHWPASHLCFETLSAISNVAEGDIDVAIAQSIAAHLGNQEHGEFQSVQDVLESNLEDPRVQEAISVVREDIELASVSEEQLRTAPLWPRRSRKSLSNSTLQIVEAAAKGDRYSSQEWRYWLEWLTKLIKGDFGDAELQVRISALENDVWDAGVTEIHAEIELILATHLADKLPQAEVIEFNTNTGKFYATPIPVQNAPLMSAILINIADTLDDAVQGANGLSERSSEFRKINRAVTRYANNPQQAELTLTTVAKGLRRQIHDTKELPDSEDNLALLDAIEEGVRGIRANHVEIAINREQLARQAFKELLSTDRELLEQAQPVFLDWSEDEMAEDFAEDIPNLINDSLLPIPDGAPRLPGADAATRVFSRASKMAQLIEKAAEWHDSKGNKALKLGIQTTGIAGTLYAVVQLGLKLLGVL